MTGNFHTRRPCRTGYAVDPMTHPPLKLDLKSVCELEAAATGHTVTDTLSVKGARQHEEDGGVWEQRPGRRRATMSGHGLERPCACHCTGHARDPRRRRRLRGASESPEGGLARCKAAVGATAARGLGRIRRRGGWSVGALWGLQPCTAAAGLSACGLLQSVLSRQRWAAGPRRCERRGSVAALAYINFFFPSVDHKPTRPPGLD